MPALEGPLQVEGLRELSRAFNHMSRDLNRELRAELKEVAEPVRRSAENMARANIPNIGPRWSRMKIGVTQKTVYIAPKSRRRRGTPRKNLAGLLVKQAMLPARNQNEAAVVRGVERMLDRLQYESGF